MKNASYKTQQATQTHLLSLSLSASPKTLYQRLVALVFLLLLPLFALADTLTVTADRQTIEMGDLITLQIEADFQTRGNQLNLDSLKDQFEVLGRQQSNRIEVINGKFSSTTAWQVTLLAKHIGELVIPPLQVSDVKSQPYKITVTPVQKKSAQNRGTYFVESSLSKQQAYIQEEVLYSLKLYFLGNFTGSVRPPQFQDALSVTLKDQNIYGKQINGQQYTVYEWLYALYPQQSGELKINGPVFSGIHLYRGRQKGIQESAENHLLKVLPAPDSFSQSAHNFWLPAKSVRFDERWQSLPKTVRVGDSLNRTLILDVVGLKASQLPQLTTENQTGFKVYADQPESEEAILPSGLRSQIQVSQAIIPTQTGLLTLPEQSIQWWNSETNKIQTSTIAARSFTVLPALNIDGQNSAHLTGQTMDLPIQIITDSNPTNLAENGDVSRETSSTWTLFTVLLGLAWFITLGILYRQNQRFKALLQRLELSKTGENIAEKQSDLQNKDTPIQANKLTRQTIEQAAKTNGFSKLCDDQTDLSANDFYHQLRVSLADQFDIQSFNEIEYAPLKQSISDLESHLFNQSNLADDTLKIICKELQTFATQQQQSAESDSKSESKLAELYKR